ncbi:uncharacterized protein C1orf87 [Cynoglossus semilaevis]|uniref:uncharacterized protein C1orf87 n=1 Tax=Cynoglossus semilaevis TaxID=244447 RepID=UPI0007DCA42F|nr:uncharacterized protein C1orf87 homolog [Cynoglossus semilaevis]
MAQKNTTGVNTKPRLVVKIVGSKHIKQFIEEQQGDLHQKKEETTAAAETVVKPPDETEVTESASQKRLQSRVDSAVWTGINQVPDRFCVSAPSSDRSRSYIHPKTSHVIDRRSASGLETRSSPSEDTGSSELSSVLRQELCDWQLSSLRAAEGAVSGLDPSSSGTVSRPQITQLFLKQKVPLKLPTFSLLLNMFSDEEDAALIYYRKLLEFIEASTFPGERHSDRKTNLQSAGAT